MVEGDLGGRRVLLGVAGSIAAYRAADIASALTRRGADVHVVLTRHAAAFVGPPTFRALTANPVLSGVFDEPYDRHIAHIHLAQSVDLILVAPATANVLAKMAHGIADDMLTTLLLAATAPVLAAPAMNPVMLAHPATQANIGLLRERGVRFVQPGQGRLACGAEGIGRLAEVDTIVGLAADLLLRQRDLRGLRLLVTAGATREPLDPVRYLTNRSSGKMGYAVAAAAAQRGAEVTLVSGPAAIEPPAGVDLVRVGTAAEMLEACRAPFADCAAFVAAAAPADYTPEAVEPRKIKKRGGDPLALRLVPTPDILATLAARKRAQVVVGFAAETENLLANAAEKLVRKGLDLVAANDVTEEGAGFEVDTNRVTLLWPDGRSEALPLLPKRDVAERLLDAVRALVAARPA